MFKRCSQVVAQALNRAYRKLPRLEDLPDAHLLPSIALVGRPNVGKSALYNRLVHRREALVFDTPSDHVTRDYREGLAQLADLRFRVIDTSGLEPAAAPGSLQGRAAALTRDVLRGSHGVVMILDARSGVVAGDEELLSWLRRNNTQPLVVVANKADTKQGRNNLDQITADLAQLGLEPPMAISATSGDGLADLYQLLQPMVDAGQQELHNKGRQGLIQGRQQSAMQQASPVAQEQEQQPQQQQQQQQCGLQHLQEQPEFLDASDELIDPAGVTAEEEAAADALVKEHLAAEAAGSASHVPRGASSQSSDEEGASEGAALKAGNDKAGPLRLAILGLPNVGKSTLMNALLGFERSLTGPEPGLTRDPTYGWIRHAEMDIQLVDTAGWKRASAMQPTQSPTAAASMQIGSGGGLSTAPSGQGASAAAAGSEREQKQLVKQLTNASLLQARRALAACHVVVLLLDAPRLLVVDKAMTRLELQLAGMALEQGKAIIIGLNKSDAVPGGSPAALSLQAHVEQLLEAQFLQAGKLPVLLLSAQEGSGTVALMDAVVDAYSKWNRRVSSLKVRTTLAKHSVRFHGTGGTASLLQRVKWAVQLKARPPTFVLLLRGAASVDDSGQRFLCNVLRQSLKLQGVPLRLYLRYNKRYVDPSHVVGIRQFQARIKQRRQRKREKLHQRNRKHGRN